MAFSISCGKCKTCGGGHIKPSGKLKGLGYDNCPKCREAKRNEWTAKRERDHTDMVTKCGDAIGGFDQAAD